MGIVDARTRVEHLITDVSAEHRHAGRYLVLCGSVVLAASLTSRGVTGAGSAVNEPCDEQGRHWAGVHLLPASEVFRACYQNTAVAACGVPMMSAPDGEDEPQVLPRVCAGGAAALRWCAS